MKSLRLVFRLIGVFLVAVGLTSCNKLAELFQKKRCKGEEFTCTYTDDGTDYKIRFCEDGWYRYYVNNELEDTYYSTDYTEYWDYYVNIMRNYANNYSDIDCKF